MTRAFTIKGEHVTVCPPIPDNVTKLVITNTRITSLPALPSGLTYLDCCSNQLTSLPALPSGLTKLGCWINQLTSLPTLPSGLTVLYCAENQLTSLPALPSGLTKLGCWINQLTSMPVLPNGLTELECSENQLTSLPALPSGLMKLDCSGNPIVWCQRIKDAKRAGLDSKKMALLLRLVCKAIAREEAVTSIQWNCDRWLDAPVTNDGRLGILLRIGMRQGAGYGTWTGQEMWTKNKSEKEIWAGNDVDKEIWSLYPPKKKWMCVDREHVYNLIDRRDRWRGEL